MVSIIVPVYNIENYIGRCVESLMKQSYKDIQIILIDDGSTDNSGSICDELALTDNRIIVIHKQNGGVSSARNAGLQAAKGEFVGFVDGDDYVAFDMFEILVDSMNSCDADLSICSYNSISIVGIQKNIIEQLIIEKDKNEIEKFIRLYEQYFINALWNKLYKKSLITTNFDQNYSMGEDLIFNLAYLRNCNTIVSVPNCLYNYCLRDSSATSSFQENRISVILELHEFVQRFISDYFCCDNCKSLYSINLKKIDAAFQSLMAFSADKQYKMKIIKQWISNRLLYNFFESGSVETKKPYSYMCNGDIEKVYLYYYTKAMPRIVKNRFRHFLK